MSGTADRATRRQIRRALGPQALEAVNSHADAIEDITQIVRAHDALIHPEHGALCQDVRALKAFKALTFRARLSWLLFGA